MKFFDIGKGQADTVFFDCSDLLSYSASSSPDDDANVACISEKFEELNIEKMKAFVSDGASVMVGKKGGVAKKLRDNFTKTMINVHCICHRLGLACGDTGDDFNFIRNVEEILIELWNCFKNFSKRLHIYIKVALKSKQFDTLTPKRKKQTVKRMKKACRTRWLSLDAGVDGAWEDFGGIIDATGSTATGLLRKINNYEFSGILCLLKNMLPILSCLSKTFQTGSLNFSRITPSINKCKEKIKEVAKDGRGLKQLRDILNGKLKESAIILNETAEARIQGFVHKYATSICANISARYPENSCKVLEAFSIFDVDVLPTSPSSPSFRVHGEIAILAKQFFPIDEQKGTIVENI